MACWSLRLEENLRLENNYQEANEDPRKWKSNNVVMQLVEEVKVHQSLMHPHVVYLDHCFEDDDYKYILLEYCELGVEFLLSRHWTICLEISVWIKRRSESMESRWLRLYPTCTARKYCTESYFKIIQPEVEQLLCWWR